MSTLTIEQFLAEQETRELLRFSTAGSVDDGKSTLIGRLLYDCKSVYEDQLNSVQNSKINRSSGPIDFSLLTDGLRAEREQGITIDVAYRYFATPKRKFIIADTPGHEQYTRNMATGASTASVAIILIDARKGLLPQSRRHTYISSLLGIPNIAVAINKMDLVDFSEQVYRDIQAQFYAFAHKLHFSDIQIFPVSALNGDNIAKGSTNTPWYSGPTLLEYLETVPVSVGHNFEDVRLPVQYVVRPDLDFRGFAGQVASGTLRPGDTLMALPSGRTSKVKRLVTYDGDLPVAFPPQSVCVTLEDEIDISRGDMLVSPLRMPHVSRRIEAAVVWMSHEPLDPARPYLVKHTTQQVGARVTRIVHRIDVNTLEAEAADKLELNEIGTVAIETTKPLFFDAYRRNRTTGSLILIDPITNATLAAGMIVERQRSKSGTTEAASRHLQFATGRLTPAERYTRAGHLPVTIWLTARAELAWLLERKLFDRGCFVQALADDVESHLLPEMARLLNTAGLIAICSVASDDAEERIEAQNLIGERNVVAYQPGELSPQDEAAVQKIIADLEQRGVFLPGDFASGEGI
ncbi:MAG: sulfate adenylyltransferase subunit CysN [Bryobacterales bacterium]|nr:sulfate adenylyltransferase subunit CysN [Bryobacterales bacterium]